MDRNPTVNSSPTAAANLSSDKGQAPSGGRGESNVNQPVKSWPKSNSTTKPELDAILKRLAERVQYITGATGAAIGLLEGTEMVCRATSGTTAPDLGVHLDTWKGLSGECIRTGGSLRCDNVEMDGRVEVESCRRMGVQSIVATPVRRNNVIVGLFELFSSQPYAFQERDVATLQRTAELVKKELEKRPLVVDAAYVRLPEQAAQNAAGGRSVDSSNGQNGDLRETPGAQAEIVVVLGAGGTAAGREEYAESALPQSLTPCRNCGGGVPEGRLLCPSCGSLQVEPDSLVIPLPETQELDPPKFLEQSEEPGQAGFKYGIRVPKYSIGAILAMLALFVAFVPIHTNQPANAEAASSAPAQERALPSLPVPSQAPASAAVTVEAPPGNSATQNPATPNPVMQDTQTSTSAPITSAPTPTSQASALTPAATESQPPVYAAPAPSYGPPAAAVQPRNSNPRLNQAGWETSTTVATETQSSEPVPQVIPIGPIAGTPHASPEAQQQAAAVLPQYQAPPPPTVAKKPWFIARIDHAIDSLQQMFESPPDPGPTAEQLGDPGVVVWVDLSTGLYYCPGASSYGKTEKGKFLTQKEAHAEYFTSAIRIGCK